MDARDLVRTGVEDGVVSTEDASNIPGSVVEGEGCDTHVSEPADREAAGDDVCSGEVGGRSPLCMMVEEGAEWVMKGIGAGEEKEGTGPKMPDECGDDPFREASS